MARRRRPLERSRTAVVTGASSGIGQAAALELARRGFRVLAGVRRDEDADAADQAGLIPLRLDVTDDDQVDGARRAVEAEGRGRLEVLVNSAGIAIAGPLEAIDTEALRAQLDINLLGVHRMIRALLPPLVAAGGTIINLSSLSGRIGFPYLGPYVASKHALEGYSDALRRELSPHRVRVVVIEPGAVDTPMWQRSTPTAEMIERLPERYRAEALRVFSGMSRVGPRGAPAQRVAEVIARAATADRPRARYALPLGAAIQARLIPALPESLVDRIADRRLGRR